MGLRRVPGTILPLGEGLHVSHVPIVSVDALRMMPDNCYILGHVPAQYDLSGFRVITVFRDPRNVLISYIRHREREDNLMFSISHALNDFWGVGFVRVYEGYLGWRGRSLILRYEDMPPSVLGDGRGIYQGHGKDYNTRTGSPSRWQDHWDEATEHAWIAHGGYELMEKVGYT